MRAGTAPLSYGQELFWLLDRSTPALTAYNVPRGFRIHGRLDAEALARALDGLIERHEVLRSVYALSGEQPVQVPLPSTTVPFERVDLSGLPDEAREAELAGQLRARVAHHFDLASEIPMRATLFRLTDQEHVLFLLTHHIVSDGWSKSVTFRDLSELYAASSAGRAPVLPALPMQFADYARAERAALAGNLLDPKLAYWREQLRGPLPVLDLPTDRPRAGSHSFEGGMCEATLPRALLDGMRKLGQARGASLYMVLLAAYQTLLHRYSGQEEIIVGSPTAGREDEATQELIGYFANALVLRTSFAGDPSFGELLDRVANTCLDAYEHQDVPFETLVLELQKGEQLTHAPLFQCVLTMEDTVPATLTLGGTRLEPVDVLVAGTKFDLTLLFSEQPEGLRLRLSYRTALFDGERIGRMLAHLRTLLEAAVANPSVGVGALPLLTTPEREQLTEWNATAWDEGHPTTITALTEAHAARVPGQTAVVGSDGHPSWRELNEQANRIAHWLVERGIGPGATVGLCLDRSAAMIAAMLGVLKAGAAYVPLVPDLPRARLAQQIADSATAVVVTTEDHAGLLPAGVVPLRLDADAAKLGRCPSTNPSPRAGPEDLAYVLYTSGSTGVPKGVGVSHANLVHYTRAIARCLGLDLAGSSPWHCATVSTLAADLGHTAVFPALCSGGTLHVLPEPVTTDGSRFAEYVALHPLDLLKITPNHLRALLAGRDPAAVLPRKWVVLGGEAFALDLAAQLVAAGTCRVLNHYGPTETTVGVCTHEALPDQLRASTSATVPIGRPLSNTSAHVLDARGELLPLGIPGELYIGGAGVARGYVGRPELTRERFVPDRFATEAGARLYRTGDRVWRLPGGELEFLGRADDQVKIRGYRVEPGEIEAVLTAHPNVRQTAVVVRAGADGAPELVGYVAGAVSFDPAALAEWLRARVPDYMIPAQWVFLPTLPLNANGKVDRRALPEPFQSGPESTAVDQAPRSDAERTLAALFAEVLKRPTVGINQDFFELGGHSLLAIRLLGRVSKAFGTRLPLRALFDAPTVADLAATLDPGTPLESQLLTIWREVLKRETVGRDDSFFELGGHSLLAIRALGRISKLVGTRLPLRTLFEAPTVRKLAAVIRAGGPADPAVEADALLEEMRKLSPEAAERLLAGGGAESGP